VRGYVNAELRKRVWPLLLGVQETKKLEKFEPCSRYGDQIQKDIDRSLYHFDVDKKMSEAERGFAKQSLSTLINSIFKENPELHYIQGFHDICTVFLRVCGKDMSQQLTEHLSKRHIRDSLRPNLDVVVALLSLLFPLIEYEDPEVFDFLSKSQVQPIFALSWVLTWFSHNVEQFEDCCRLFDFFLASHPLMPLYYSVVLILSLRKDLLKTNCEYSAVHYFFQSFPQDTDVEKCIRKAHFLAKKIPPATLARKHHHIFPKDSPLLCRDVDELENLKLDYTAEDLFDPRTTKFWTHLAFPVTLALGFYVIYSKPTLLSRLL